MEKLKELSKQTRNYNSESVDINANLQINYLEFIRENSQLEGQSKKTVYKKWVELKYMEEVHFIDAFQDWHTFADMLEFTTRKKYHTILLV
ncbi:hypothetical protein BH09BAC3_BH09BAC3_10630 [soil metagenome]